MIYFRLKAKVIIYQQNSWRNKKTEGLDASYNSYTSAALFWIFLDKTISHVENQSTCNTSCNIKIYCLLVLFKN